jgi:hypothetical protein
MAAGGSNPSLSARLRSIKKAAAFCRARNYSASFLIFNILSKYTFDEQSNRVRLESIVACRLFFRRAKTVALLLSRRVSPRASIRSFQSSLNSLSYFG